MSYAYVKFVQGKHAGKKLKVPTSKIKYTFSGTAFDKMKKYHVQYKDEEYYRAQIIFMTESCEALDELIAQKRAVITPVDQLVTTEDDSEQSKSFSSFPNDNNYKEKNIKSLSKILSVRLEHVRDVLKVPSNGDRNNSVQESEKGTSPAITDEIRDLNEEKSVSNKVSEDNSTARKPPKTAKPIITKVETQSALDIRKKIGYLEKENVNLQNKNKHLEKKNTKLKTDKMELKQKLQNMAEENETLKTLNYRLQTTMCDNATEKKAVQSQIETACSDVKYEHNYPPIGLRRESDNTIHIGRNVRISEREYGHLLSASKTPSQFAGNILTTLFGEDALLDSTCTGRGSNRNREGKTKKRKLMNLKEYGACNDLYCHWIKTSYAPRHETDEKFNFFEEMSNFNFYAAKKIAYLKRETKKKKKEDSKTNEKPTQVEDKVATDDSEKEIIVHSKYNKKRKTDDLSANSTRTVNESVNKLCSSEEELTDVLQSTDEEEDVGYL